MFLKRAHELKDEGNRRFQAKDYVGAMDIYEQALKLTPDGHPDRAVFYRLELFLSFNVQKILEEAHFILISLLS